MNNDMPEGRKSSNSVKLKPLNASVDEPPEVELITATTILSSSQDPNSTRKKKNTNPKDQEKTTFTCPYGTFAYRRMPFGLCNAPGTFQRCMMAIFHDMIEKTMEVFMDDFSVFGDSFSTCLTHLEKMLKRCEDTNLSLNWEKSHFMVKEGIVLGHKISKSGLEVDRAKVEVIAKLPHPTSVKGVKNLTYSKLAKVTVLGDTMCQFKHSKKNFDFRILWPTIYKEAHDFVTRVTIVNVKEKLSNVMNAHKTPSKFAKSLTSGALILWGRSRHPIGNSTILVAVNYLSKWVEAKALPPMMPELSANF
ncbi:reverse transcriptase domain-containing protein [Tanacetum coccineum]|uniref:Reverse transcriptase domain-containing protein n=1 Tax=Tanacetum coccineum TaxID=301880 RepID=A0ABQ5GBQ1_9ASTR